MPRARLVVFVGQLARPAIAPAFDENHIVQQRHYSSLGSRTNIDEPYRCIRFGFRCSRPFYLALNPTGVVGFNDRCFPAIDFRSHATLAAWDRKRRRVELM